MAEFINDPRGNTVATVNASGNVLGTFAALDAFGETGSNAAGPFDYQHTYPTEQFGTGPNSTALGFREYDMSTGRMLKRDPMGYGGGINLYGYTRNNPINRNDPQGLQGDSTDSMTAMDSMFGWATPKDWINAAQNNPVTQAVGMVANAVSMIPDNPISDIRDIGLLIDLLKQGCFVAGTPVQMADGSTKSIEKVQKGDLVLSRDPQTGQTEAKSVTATFVHSAAATVTLTFSNGDQVTSTLEHPYFVDGMGFVPAGQLGIGTSIVTRAGPVTQVTGIGLHSATASVYNFTVADDHTYFVGTHDGGEWVHNNCGDIALGLQKGLQLADFAKSVKAAHFEQWKEAGITLRGVQDVKHFGRTFHQACERANWIHFNLTGMGDVDEAFIAGKRGFNFKRKNGTNAELHYVLSNRATYDKTTFYRNGAEIAKPTFRGP